MSVHDTLPILVPLIILQFGLAIWALVDIFRHQQYKIGNRYFWIPMVLLISIFGPVIYFVFGRKDY
ncbi:MAG: PLDc N-terminal domain-containing protein [Lentilactobacillus hilgardii]|uniref:PLDc N-terminal domain-containing protein n=1 Tax=Lentilactobacillus hilgardii TaxID=1588 RepID=UPI001CC1EE91|nr:PLDc N-terminal domain-containing protein [Lentilactobacillus hilgardii]MBZ2199756.1 hypothetical protein [Lentilactobacillus hilgardii]MBZ2203750.1 hypothetical protein [Lentilactobacillus hilgardii]